MEPIRRDPQDMRPSQSGQPLPPRPRPLMSDFAPRRPSAPGPLQPQPHSVQPAASLSTQAPSQSALRPVAPAQQPLQRPTAPPAIGASSASLLAPPPAATARPELPLDMDQGNEDLAPAAETKKQKEPSRSGHAGLISLAVFIVLCALALLPLLPGKVLNNFPGSSVSFSTGEQSLACASDLSPVITTTSSSKTGFPVAYNDATTSTIQASCDGKAQSATGGHTSQFNPLGAAIDVAVALVIAVVVAKVWGKIFGRRR